MMLMDSIKLEALWLLSVTYDIHVILTISHQDSEQRKEILKIILNREKVNNVKFLTDIYI